MYYMYMCSFYMCSGSCRFFYTVKACHAEENRGKNHANFILQQIVKIVLKSANYTTGNLKHRNVSNK